MPRWSPLGRSRVRWLHFLPVLVLALIAGSTLYAAEGSPTVILSRTLETSVVIPGPPPKLAWPAHGSAAIAVTGLGTLGSVRGNSPKPIASMAKMMTAYLTLLEYPLSVGEAGFTYTVTKADVTDLHNRVALDQSTLAVKAGERLNEYQLLEGLLIPSGNNVAVILARHDANGNLDAFLAKMSSEAKGLGLTHTTYTDPSGYEPTTVSTALDQLALAQLVMTNPVFAQIVGKTSVTLPVAGKVRNDDTLVGHDGFVGIKTGSDSQAEGCLAFADRRIVAGQVLTVYGVVMGQGKVAEGSVVLAAIHSAEALANSVVANLTVRVAIPPTTRVLMATGAGGDRVTAVTTKALMAVGWGGLPERVDVSLRPAGNHVQAGQVLASVELQGPLRPGTTGTTGLPAVEDLADAVNATATTTLHEPGLGWRLCHLFGD